MINLVQYFAATSWSSDIRGATVAIVIVVGPRIATHSRSVGDIYSVNRAPTLMGRFRFTGVDAWFSGRAGGATARIAADAADVRVTCCPRI